MTTSLAPPTDGAQSPSVDGKEPPLLTGEDLDDLDQFVTVRRVPVLDAHADDPERGPVSADLLATIAERSNARAARGDFPALILGHTRPKRDREEIEQPPVVGYASGFHVADYQGRPCLHCDFHVHARDAAYAKTFPFRSVERLDSPDDFVDRIALLRTPPQRDLGALHYARADDGQPVRRLIYGRAFPRSDDGASPGFLRSDHPEPPTPNPSEDATMADPTAMAPPPDPAAAAPPPPAPDPAAAPSMTIGQMAPEQFVALIVEGFRQALHEEAGAPDDADMDQEGAPDEAGPDEAGGEGPPVAEQDGADESMGDEPDPAEDEERDQYEASEAGPDNTYAPGDCSAGDDKEKRRMYQESQRIKRHKYERDAAQQRQVNDLLIQGMGELEHKLRRVLYEKTLIQLEAEGYEIDRADEMESLKLESTPDYEASQEARIRKCYRRSPVGTRTQVGVANFTPPAPAEPPRPMGRDQTLAVANYVMKQGVSVPEAKKALNIA